MSKETQAMCFLAGANSIFYGEKLLTTPNPEKNEDLQLLSQLGIKIKKDAEQRACAEKAA
jgi:biotin synthase